MNKVLPILTVILLLAVAFLYYKQFSGSGGGAVSKRTVVNISDSAGPVNPVRIGYFEMDSVEENFDFFKEVQKEMNRKQDAKVSELTQLQRKLQQKYDEFQSKAPSMTQAQGESAQRELQQLDNNIRSRGQQLDQQASDYFMKKQQEILNMIREFFEDYNKDKGYTYIFASEPGLMYLKDTAYNVTNDLLKGLNEKFKAKKGK